MDNVSKTRKLRALVVDDSADDRTLLSRALIREDFTCDTASDGIMADNLLRAKTYDVVVTDLKMPRKHGHQLIVELLSRPNPPMVVAITGLAEPKLVVDLLERGVAEVAQKPLSHMVLAAKIRAMLRKHLEQAENAPPAAEQMAVSIQHTTDNLRTQLAEMTKTFEGTILKLEAQKKQLETGFMDSLRVLGTLLSQTGMSKQSHVGRVEAMVEMMGESLGFSGERMRHLKFSALLHDIGQFGMPDAVRNKPVWALHADELKTLRSYPLIGAALLSEVRGAEEVSEIIEMHCENFDGTGFPKGLQGNEIRLEARLLRVADGCDSFQMSSGETERLDHLREHLAAESGRAYDPQLASLGSQMLGRIYRKPREDSSEEVPPGRLVPGMVLAENVYDDHGHFLARQGAELSSQMIGRLIDLLGPTPVLVHTGR